MAEPQRRWSWPKLGRAWRTLSRKARDVDDAEALQSPDPWLALTRVSGEDGTSAPAHRYVRDQQAAEWEAAVHAETSQSANGRTDAASEGARWLGESSPYGFADEDGTLKQVDSAHWRQVLARRRKGRFVPTRTSSPSAAAVQSGGSTWLLQFTASVGMLAVGLYATHSDSALAAGVRHVYQFAFAQDLSQNTVGKVEGALARLHLSVPAMRGTGAMSTHVPLNGSIETDYSSSHPEIGLVGRAGDPVLAAASGTVTSVSSGAQGVSVVIDHGAALGVTHYSGLASASVRQGEYVSVGEVIGRLPANNKPILHFSLEQGGRYVNPHDYIHFPSDSP